MDWSEMSARVRLNMKRSLLESQRDRSKQRLLLDDLSEDEVMIGEVQMNEDVQHPRSEVSATEFDDWQQEEHEGILKELSTKNDFMSFHGVPSSEIASKEVIKTLFRGNTNSSVVQFGSGFGSKTCRTGQLTNNCVARCFHCVSSCRDER